MIFRKMPTVLSIAGSDCSGGAGIQADIKTIEANGCYAMTAITSLTAQNTTGVRGISDVSPDFLRLQLDACFDDIRPHAVKLGMVSDSNLIRVIADVLKKRRAENIIIDPVMVSTSGSKLLKADAVEVLKNELLPLASLITPNIPEAELLTGIEIRNREDMVTAGIILSDRYNVSVLIKGGHSINDANDILVEGKEVTVFAGERIDNDNTHGTGCTLSSAIASGLAKGLSMTVAITQAKAYISGALKYGINLGMGSGPLNHIWNRVDNKKLKKCLAQSLMLYGVTDGTSNENNALSDKVEAAIKGGITFLQLREKNISEEQYVKDAREIKALADKYNIPLLINDNVQVALECGADGVHLGQDDMDVSNARILLGDDKIIGATAHNIEEAIRAECLGADYLGVGAVFGTSTKDNTIPVTYDALKEICNTVSIPVVAIAGINEANVMKLAGSGIAGVAVVSAIFGAENIETATKNMKKKTREMLEKNR